MNKEVFSPEQIEQLTTIVRGMFNEFKKELEDVEKRNEWPPLDLQLRRSKCNEIIYKEHAFDTKDMEQAKAELVALPVLTEFKDYKDIQEILDVFDYGSAVEVAKNCGWKYRGEDITYKDLVGDAIEAFRRLLKYYKNCESGYQQVGRLLAVKTTCEGEECYSLAFCAELFNTSEV